MRSRFAFPLLSAAFAALAVAVAAGALTGVDQWSVDHLMPGASLRKAPAPAWHSLVPLLGVGWHHPWSVATNLVALPASFFVALALTWWRSRPLAVVLVLGTAVETLCKETLTRPALYDGSHHVVGFDTSFPSGHTLRTLLVAAAFASPWSAAWAVAALALIELNGWHTPTDIAGGALLAGLALLGARALRRRRLPGGRA